MTFTPAALVKLKRRLPPLNALRAFEAAARHLSFTKAADELNVTQAAVSHQIKGLEDWLGTALFRRLNRSLLLTDQGQVLLPAATEAFDRLASGVAMVRRRDQEGVLSVTTLDSFASAWLVPRLGKFRQRHPDVDVRVTVSDQVMDLGAEGLDVGIRYGLGDWTGVEATKLLDETLFPVAAPDFAGRHQLRTPEDLGRVTLLHDDMPLDWEDWFRAAGCDEAFSKRGPGFTHSNLVLISARAGEGVALGRSVLVDEDLRAGRLVRICGCAMNAPQAYYIITPKGSPESTKVKAFKKWLLSEAGPKAGA